MYKIVTFQETINRDFSMHDILSKYLDEYGLGAFPVWIKHPKNSYALINEQKKEILEVWADLDGVILDTIAIKNRQNLIKEVGNKLLKEVPKFEFKKHTSRISCIAGWR